MENKLKCLSYRAKKKSFTSITFDIIVVLISTPLGDVTAGVSAFSQLIMNTCCNAASKGVEKRLNI